MSTDQEIGRRLIAVREHFGFSQVNFAGKLNIAKNTLNGYESGKRRLPIENVGKIRDRWGVSADWLLFGDIGQPGYDLAVQFGPTPSIKADKEKPKPAKKRRKPAKKQRKAS
jgi:transcriptional regulator with XRE-family HTH domain